MRFLWEKLLLVFIIISTTVSVSPAQNGKDWWISLFNEGFKLIEQQQYAAAREQFKKILKRNKKVAPAYYGLGLSYAAEKPDSRDALNQFKKATKIDKHYGEAYYQSALVYINLKRFRSPGEGSGSLLPRQVRHRVRR